MAFGTHSVADTLAAFERGQNLSLTEFGVENAYAAIAAYLAAHNALTAEIISELCQFTTERLAVGGAVATMVMEDADEFTTPDAQKITAGANLGFPLLLTEIGVQWTRKYLQNAFVGDLKATTDAVMTADRRRVSRDVRRAIFLSTNYTATDKLVDNMALPVKRLVNADSFPIPPSAYGTTFNAATHTHYIARVGTLAASDVQALIDTVVEHSPTANVRITINSADEAAFRALTGFVGYVDARVVQPQTATYAQGGLNMTSTGDRAIGVFSAAEVWVKPWALQNYFLCQDLNRKPCWFRTRPGVAGAGELQLVAEIALYPLQAKAWEREFGVGVYDRTAAAVLYIGGTTTYVDPTIT